jgi:hypothetical protein
LTFVYSWFGLLFPYCTTLFVVLKGKKWCWPRGFLFQNGIDMHIWLWTITKLLILDGFDIIFKVYTIL